MKLENVAVQEATRRGIVGREDYERFAPIVRRIAMRVARKVPRDITVNDLIGYGWMGLLEANTRATSSMTEEEFEAYASHRIRGAMLDYLRSLDPLARGVRAQSRRVAEAITALTKEQGRPPEEEEVASRLEMRIEDYRTLLQRIAEAGMARLEVIDFDEVELGGEATDERVDRKMLIEAVSQGIEQLPERLKYVVSLYYTEQCTLAQIGRILGVTEARACQLHSEAMHRLRAMIGRT